MTEKHSSDEVAKAYRAVFGVKGKRSKAQMIVLADIEDQGGIWRNGWIPRESGDKDKRNFLPVDPYDAAINEGRRVFAIRQIQLANSQPREEKQKPRVKTNE